MPATALAAPPANDDRTAPEELGRLPAQVMGTTVEATRVPTDPSSACGLGGPQVWYRFTAPADGRIALRLVAEGDLDAILDAYLSERSQTTSLSCDPTDTQGIGAVDFDVKRGRRYLIAVSMLTNSVPGDFQLTVVAPQPPPRPPGTLLAKGGVDGTLDRVGNLEDAYSLRMRAGRTYRFRLSGRSAEECAISARLYPPGSRSFDGGAVKRLGCDASGYETFTPGPGDGGRYSILVSSARGTRALQRYHLERLRRTLGRGRYFVAVRALGGGKGSYKLTRTSKVLTRTSIGFGGHRRATLGETLRVGVRVRPSVGGPFTVIIQRFDPLSGWLFHRQERGRTAAGRGSIRFQPPAIGRWRARDVRRNAQHGAERERLRRGSDRRRLDGRRAV